MKNFFILLAIVITAASCSPGTSQKLEENFIQSLKQRNFNLLLGHLATVDFFKTLPQTSGRTEEEISRFIKESNDRLKRSWQKIIDSMQAHQIDASRIELDEAVLYDPFAAENEMEGMIIVYSYKDRKWDDISLIVTRWKDKVLLLEIPNPTKVFSFSDSSLSAVKNAKLFLEMQKPEFKSKLEELVKSIIKAAKENNLPALAQHLVYRGEDESRKWKSAVNINDSLEMKQAADFMARVSNSVSVCAEYTTGDIRKEKESEGTWIVLPVKCGDKTVHFAFLSIENKMLLGDIDTEN